MVKEALSTQNVVVRLRDLVEELQFMNSLTMHFSHVLNDDGIACAGERFVGAEGKEVKDVVNTFEPSLVVGADGEFSQVMYHPF